MLQNANLPHKGVYSVRQEEQCRQPSPACVLPKLVLPSCPVKCAQCATIVPDMHRNQANQAPRRTICHLEVCHGSLPYLPYLGVRGPVAPSLLTWVEHNNPTRMQHPSLSGRWCRIRWVDPRTKYLLLLTHHRPEAQVRTRQERAKPECLAIKTIVSVVSRSQFVRASFRYFSIGRRLASKPAQADFRRCP